MSRNELFMMMLVTVLMVETGVREARHNLSLGIVMIAIPLIGWLALLLGKA